MKKRTKVALWILVPLATLFLHVQSVHWFQQRYVPPQGIKNISDLLEWTGRPWWVTRYSSPKVTYYEVRLKVPTGTLMMTLASGPPSYTVDENGQFIGWSPDSGDIHTPDVLKSPDLKKESIDVEEFLRRWK
jgi:hypothetical protein